jgi:hypothetical protein
VLFPKAEEQIRYVDNKVNDSYSDPSACQAGKCAQGRTGQMCRKYSGVRKKPMKQPLVRKRICLQEKVNDDQEITKGNFMAVETCRSILSLHELRHLSADVSKLRNL